MRVGEVSAFLLLLVIPCIRAVIPGGISEIPVDDPEVVRLSQVALLKLNEGKRGEGESNLVEVVKASRQIVSGTLTRLTLRVAEGDIKRTCEVKIWEQPWLNKTEVTFSDCNEEPTTSGNRKKRNPSDDPPILGGVSEIPVDDPEVVRLSQVALLKLNEGKRGEGESNLVEIIKASRQIVSGTLTTLTLRVAKGDIKRTCEVKIWEQPWLNKTEVTFSDCNEEPTTSGNRKKRNPSDDGPLAGGISEIPVDDPEVVRLSQVALLKLNEGKRGEGESNLVEIIKASRQIVSGTLTRLTLRVAQGDIKRTCEVKIWEQPWLNKTEVTFSDCKEEPATNRRRRSKDTPLYGGVSEIPVDDPEVVRLSQVALLKLNEGKRGEGESNLVEVVKASRQIVSGTLTTLTLRVAKGDIKRTCEVKIWEQPWLNKTEVTFSDCNEEPTTSGNRKKRNPSDDGPLAGGISEIPVDDPEVVRLSQVALLKLNEGKRGEGESNLVEVVKASRQIVSGTLTRLTLRVAQGDIKRTCEVKIWEQPWLNKTEVTFSDCKEEPATNRRRRSKDTPLSGGVSEIPVDDPEVVRLSQVALMKLNEGKRGEGESNLVEVVKASRQIVSGTLTTLTLRVAKGETKRTCEVKIWEQPWLNKTEVTFSDCGEEPSTSSNRKRRSDEEEEGDKLNAVRLQMFNDFIKKHNKVYESEKEYKKRFHIFRANLNKIKYLRKSEQGTAQYGVTWFADLSAKEFKKHLGFKVAQYKNELPPAEIPNITLPDNFDWRNFNVVTPVKDQKMCGSCWAFSVTGNVEGQWALKRGELVSLSEQELVDCDSVDNGCNGGDMTTAYQAIMKLGGLETETDYPYEATSHKCNFESDEVAVEISGAVNITSDEVKMAQWLFKNGPISIALNAAPMQFYFGGISHPIKFMCDPNELDHGVLIVGFGVHHSTILHRTVPYWIIKNSWGKHWGEKGYYRLYRGDGSCGVDKMVSSALVD